MAGGDPGAVRPHVGQREGHHEAEDAGADQLQHGRTEQEVERRRVFQRPPVGVRVQVDVPETEHQRQRLQRAEQRAPELPELRRADPEVVVRVADQPGQPHQRDAPEHGEAHRLHVGLEHQHQEVADQADVDHFPHAFHPVMHHEPAEVLLQVQPRHVEQAEHPHHRQRADAQAQAPVHLVPFAHARERAQHHEGEDQEADQDQQSGDAPGFEVFQPLLQPRLPQPPAGDAAFGQELGEEVPDHDADHRVEQELDQPRRHQLAPGQQGRHEQDRADEAADDPHDAEVEMLGAGDVEVEPALQEGRVDLLRGQDHAVDHLHHEQHQHQHEKAQAQALGLVFGLHHCFSSVWR